MKLRNGKFMQLGSTPYPVGGIGASVQHQRGNLPPTGAPKKLLGASNHHSIGQAQLPKFLRNKLLSHYEPPTANTAAQASNALPEPPKKELAPLDAVLAGETKPAALEKSRRSAKWSSNKASFALPKSKAGGHISNLQNEGGEIIAPMHPHLQLASNELHEGVQLDNEQPLRPSEKRISSAGDISAFGSTANRQKSGSKIGLSQKNLNSQPQKVTLASRNRQYRFQDNARAGAASGIDIRRKSKDNMSLKSLQKRTGAGADKDCNSEYVWEQAQGDAAAQPPSSLNRGPGHDTFELSDGRATGHEKRRLYVKHTDAYSKMSKKTNADNILQTYQ